jgi:hypothetical protein
MVYEKSFIGRRFFKLVVESVELTPKDQLYQCICLCDCGNRKKICLSPLKKGKSKSCGLCEKNNSSIEELIKERYVEENDCWIWKGYLKNKNPALNPTKNNKSISVSPYLFEKHYQIKVQKRTILRTCNNKSCINPKHMYLTSNKHGNIQGN